MTYVSPSLHKTAFNCPLCGALAHQKWYLLLANEIPGDDPLPRARNPIPRIKKSLNNVDDQGLKAQLQRALEKLETGRPTLGDAGDSYFSPELFNVFLARCFNCSDLSVWIDEKLVFPQRGAAPLANPDLSVDIRRDYDEASSIFDQSPRGAAALLRLAIQKLCKELDLPGKDLNKDIGVLVSKGLDQEVQMALDAVRVIGNNAVHPGQMNLRDDRSTAEALFMLLNLIADRMITQPKRVGEIYATLPEGARKAIKERDASS